ncbi:hypothetical protein NUW54_g12520 [Trametes sanguinea]|uniref:Uncharacterized protein n=1 Tax=Trametes sanguinea TaxID=158606 RepID=A0ACC1MX24_9APHY|nr:hypothetical protein NUW54_g12520 [Trametes sanguinea]
MKFHRRHKLLPNRLPDLVVLCLRMLRARPAQRIAPAQDLVHVHIRPAAQDMPVRELLRVPPGREQTRGEHVLASAVGPLALGAEAHRARALEHRAAERLQPRLRPLHELQVGGGERLGRPVRAARPGAQDVVWELRAEVGGGGEVAVVGVIMGSDSDLPTMLPAADILNHFKVPYELTIVSAHRTPDRLVEYARSAASRGLRVIIAGAGGAAHLPGMVAAMTALPVIGVPVKGSSLDASTRCTASCRCR